MTITMNDSPLKTIEELRKFLKSSTLLVFKGLKRDEIYEWVEDTIIKFDYHILGKKDKGIVKKYLEKITGLSRAQVTRLIGKQRKTGRCQLENKFVHENSIKLCISGQKNYSSFLLFLNR